MKEVKIGDKVRTHDFPMQGMHKEGEYANYIEGTVVALHPEGVVKISSSPLYEVAVERVVRRGEEKDTDGLEKVYPPFNGLDSMFGETCGVEVINE